MGDRRVTERAIEIAAPQQTVFDFVTDYTKDPLWRFEATSFEVSQPFEVGASLVEHATFDGRSMATPLVLMEYDAPRLSRIRTAPGFPTYLENTRLVEAVTPDTSRFTHRLVADPELLRTVLPDLPPVEELIAWYGGLVESYLAKVKTILEK